MSSTNLKLDSKDVIFWFNAIRNLPDNEKNRALDAFWAGQIDSKCWLVNELNTIVSKKSNIYIFGGWVGVLASMLFQSSTYEIGKIRSIDSDPWCESVADMICKPHEMNDWRFKARTNCMSYYEYEWNIDPHIVINTSTEHITQETYDRWYANIPKNALVVIQGNNFFSCDDHIRCSNNLEEFKIINRVRNIIFEGELPHDLYTRYMCIFKK